MSTKISNQYYDSDWNSLDFKTEDSWRKAISIVSDRFEFRYWKQIYTLLNNPNRETANNCGFAVMSLACLLIESLQQYREGITSTPFRTSTNHFHSFFNQSKQFSAFFQTKNDTRVFYEHIRCGLLHESQVKYGSKITAKVNAPVLEWSNAENHNDGIIIQRTKFVLELRGWYDTYMENLLSDSHGLREKMRVKHESCFQT